MNTRASLPRCPALDAIVGQDPALVAALARATRVAPTRMPVLVTGESGTGKELLARALHELGPAPDGPFVAVNCGALSRELAESELFGHERGAFTGAGGRRAGWFEEAAGGTLVLDEIGELPLDLQPKLLRVLETGRLRRVGGNGEVAVRVRIIAMTLRDLRREAQRGAFRLDLYHRLAGFEVALPPLRERPSDVPRLAEHFLREIEPETGRKALAPAPLARLVRHDWPGNVRELRNVIRRAAVLAPDALIGDEHCELEAAPPDDRRLADRAAELAAPYPALAEAAPAWALTGPPAPRGTLGPSAALSRGVLHLEGRSFDDLEKEIFAWALWRNGGSRRQAARMLGISRSTFCERVIRLGVASPRSSDRGPGVLSALPAAPALRAPGAAP